MAGAFVDALAEAGQKWWQMLPLGPTGYGDSPYQCFSAFAGNPNLISPDLLVRDGLVRQADLAAVTFPADHVEYDSVVTFKAEVTGVTDRRVQFRVEAWDEKEKVGEGTHERAVINVAKFATRLAEKMCS